MRTLNDAEEVSRRGGKAREDTVEGAGPEVIRHNFGKYGAEIGSEREVASLEELLLLETRPAPVHLAALDVTADHEQRARVSMIGPAITVLARHPPELGHGENHDIVHLVTEIGDKRGDRAGEIVEPLRELTR